MIDLNSAVVQDLSRRWQEGGRAFAVAFRMYVERGEQEGWDHLGPAPVDDRNELSIQVQKVIRAANLSGELSKLRAMFTPATQPFGEFLNDNGHFVGPLVFLPDRRILVRVGAPYEPGTVYLIDGPKVDAVEGVLSIGRSPDRQLIALARADGVYVCEGWERPVVNLLNWPTGLEGEWAHMPIAPLPTPPPITQLIPFPQGERVLLVSSHGTFLLGPTGGMRIHPEAQREREHIEWRRSAYPEDPIPFTVRMDMEHAAMSREGNLVAVGDQGSQHRVLTSDMEEIASIGPASSYPHHAVFSADGSQVALNACHFYNGDTVGVPTDRLRGLKINAEELAEPVVLLEAGCRVYASAVRKDEYIFGDAHGYLRTVNTNGARLWDFFLGGTISGMDISADGKFLVVGTCAGMLHLLELDAETRDESAIGSGMHLEQQRWLFWKNEKQPLVW